MISGNAEIYLGRLASHFMNMKLLVNDCLKNNLSVISLDSCLLNIQCWGKNNNVVFRGYRSTRFAKESFSWPSKNNLLWPAALLPCLTLKHCYKQEQHPNPDEQESYWLRSPKIRNLAIMLFYCILVLFSCFDTTKLFNIWFNASAAAVDHLESPPVGWCSQWGRGERQGRLPNAAYFPWHFSVFCFKINQYKFLN